VLIPSLQQLIAILPQMADNIADLVRREAGIDRKREVMEPEFAFFIA
jgi:hypothetical protein